MNRQPPFRPRGPTRAASSQRQGHDRGHSKNSHWSPRQTPELHAVKVNGEQHSQELRGARPSSSMPTCWSFRAGVLCCLQAKAGRVQRTERLHNSKPSISLNKTFQGETGSKPAAQDLPERWTPHPTSELREQPRNHTDPGSAPTLNLLEGRGGAEHVGLTVTYLGACAVPRDRLLWAKVSSISGDSPLGPKIATRVVPGALTKTAWHKTGAPKRVGELMSCQPEAMAQGARHHPPEQHFLQSWKCLVISAVQCTSQPHGAPEHMNCGYCNGGK